MGYTKVFGYPHLLFPASARWVLAADLVGLVAMVVRRNRVALFLVVMGGLSAAAVIASTRPDKLYNVRFLPLWFLCLYLLAGYALAEVGLGRGPVGPSAPAEPVGPGRPSQPRRGRSSRGAPGTRVSGSADRCPPRCPAGAVVGPLVALAAACLVVVPPLVLPATTLAKVGVTVGANQPSAWAAWNYSGYERQARLPRVPRGDPDDGQGRGHRRDAAGPCGSTTRR